MKKSTKSRNNLWNVYLNDIKMNIFIFILELTSV